MKSQAPLGQKPLPSPKSLAHQTEAPGSFRKQQPPSFPIPPSLYTNCRTKAVAKPSRRAAALQIPHLCRRNIISQATPLQPEDAPWLQHPPAQAFSPQSSDISTALGIPKKQLPTGWKTHAQRTGSHGGSSSRNCQAFLVVNPKVCHIL